MITCRDVLDFLHDYAAGTLNASQLGAFEEHLVVCPPCVAYLDSYRTASALSRASQCSDDAGGALPEELVRAILAARDASSTP